MSYLQKLNHLSKVFSSKSQKCQNKISFCGYLPLASLIVKTQTEEQILCVIGNEDYRRKLVLTDLQGNIIKTILDIETDNALLSENQTHIFVVSYNSTKSKIYKFSKTDLQYESALEISATIQSFVATDTNIYAYDAQKGIIIEIDLTTPNITLRDIKEHKKDSTFWTHTSLSAYDQGYISIGIPKDETEFVEFKNFLAYHFGSKIAQQNNQISDIAYDATRKRLFIAFSNFIAIIEEGLCTSIIHLKNKGIVSLNYNNTPTIDSLSICYSNLLRNKVDGDILILNSMQIEQLKINIEPFDLLNGATSLISDFPSLQSPKTKELLPNK